MTEKNESPYRKFNGYVEKEELEETNNRWRKDLSNASFLWVILALLLFSVFISFGSRADRLVIQQNEHYRQVLIQHASQGECFLRYQYVIGQQETASECADMCIRFLGTDYKSISAESLEGERNRCMHCLVSVASPMPFEVANPPCLGHLR